jgi:hypothetical protein
MPEATAPLASRSPQSIAVDNLLRRELRIADPKDPTQIAQGLLSRYPDTLDQMRRERDGMNYGAPVQPSGGDPTPAIGASATEMAMARDDLERDIATLSTSSELKEIDVELKGWGRAVRQAASDGVACASMALDSVQSDRAMAARRTLGDYARLARYVGALSADTAPLFRHFAQSCDVMAALVLVGIGDGLAANGVTRGTALIRVSAGDLQGRRNAVIQAFRTMTGSALAPSGQDEYPRGLEAYRILTRQLEAAGQSDLRTLLDEASLASELDQLVDLAVGATAGGLRELSTTSMIVIDRLSRLVDACRAADVPLGGSVLPGTPEAPPMVYFASSLQMFVDAFRVSTGGRLLFIARPPILSYGLYGAGPDPATQRMINLTLARGVIAEQADCVASCGCDPDKLARVVLLDFLLYRLDRAIDFYAVGHQFEGQTEPELRALSLAYLLEAAGPQLNAGTLPPLPDSLASAFKTCSANLMGALAVPGFPTKQERHAMVVELNGNYYAEQQLERLVRSLSLRCFSAGFFSTKSQRSHVCEVILGAITELKGHLTPPGAISIPPDVSNSLAAIAHNWSLRAMHSGDQG